MSEATGSGGGRAEIERRLIQRSLQDDAFRQRLLEDPKAAIEQELGTPVPEEVEIRVVEETPEIVYLVLPSTSAVGRGGELSEQDLESVAGGRGILLTHLTHGPGSTPASRKACNSRKAA